MNRFYITVILLISIINLSAQKNPKLAPTPPMGWNSWNRFACNVDENLIKSVADAFLTNGMKDAGYNYIVIDDCWQVSRDSVSGKIIADPKRFPSGIKALADYIHSKGLKFGIYSDAGRLTCQGRPGGYSHEEIDAKTYADWGVDYLKYDWCHNEGIDPLVVYPKMSKALAQSGRDIVFSICEWGINRPWTWAPEVGHLWRTTEDILDCYECTTNWGGMGWSLILDKQEGLEKYAGPGHWNDPDMLEVGNKGLTYNESQAHFSFWCLLAAPLMAGNDVRTMSDSTRSILTNKEAISVNQDVLGIEGSKKYDNGDFEIWTKPLKNDELAVILFNRNKLKQNLKVDWKMAGIDGKYNLHDIWSHKDLGSISANSSFTMPGHSVVFLRFSKSKS
jgi:alpha-galactosidase